MYYTYILENIQRPAIRYIGSTSDLRRRLKEHNSGKCIHTARFRPWQIQTYIAFHSLELAKKFEAYLKSGSGYSFAKRHFQ